MYLSYYGLNRKPFQISVDPSFLWMGEKHREAFSMMKYGILDNRGFVMLTGDVGTGKTSLIHALIGSLGPDVMIANVTDPGLEPTEFINHLVFAFNLGSGYPGKGEFLLGFRQFLENCHRSGKQVLLIIDEAQRLSRELLEEIRLLSNLERPEVKLLNIFFVGQFEFDEILSRHENRALRQRMTLHYHLEPLSRTETGQYIRHRLLVAGTEKHLFSNAAVSEIHTISGGFPRLINIICDHALLTGYVAQAPTIGTAEIRKCSRDLKLPVWAKEMPAQDEVRPWAGQRHGGGPGSNDMFNLSTHTAVLLCFVVISSIFFIPKQQALSLSEVFYRWIWQTKPVEVSAPGPQQAAPVTSMPILDVTVAAADTAPPASFPEIFDEQIVPPDMEPRLEAEQPILSAPEQDLAPSPPAPEMIPESEKHYSLLFEFNTHDLTSEGYERLGKTAALMKRNPETTLIIQGHTDASGSKAYNLTLSKFRADIAKNFLVGKDVEPERITSVGRGTAEPAGENDTPAGRRLNRRIDVTLR